MNAKKLFIVPVLFIALGVWAQEANLTMKPVAKTKYNVETSSLMDITQNMGGMEVKANGNTVAKAVLEIEEVAANGNFTILSTWNEIKATSSAMGKDTTMNFENLNLAIRTVYAKSGKMLKNERVGESTSNDPVFAMVEQMATGMKFPVLPVKTVKVGETWKSQTEETVAPAGSPLAMKVEATEECSFAGTTTKNGIEYYRINVSAPTKVSGEGSQMGMDMSIEGTGMSESHSEHDKKTLFPTFIEGKVGLDMSIMVTGAQSLAIPMTQNVTTRTTFTEVK